MNDFLKNSIKDLDSKIHDLQVKRNLIVDICKLKLSDDEFKAIVAAKRNGYSLQNIAMQFNLTLPSLKAVLSIF